MPELETSGPFVRLKERIWVRYDAIVVIRTRQLDEGEGAEVVLRQVTTTEGSPRSYAVWTDLPAAAIIEAVLYCAQNGY